MLEFNYNYSNYKSFMEQLATAVGVEVKDDAIIFPKNFASGYMKRIELPEGLQAIYASFILHTDFYLHRTKSSEEFYTLRFDEAIMAKKLVVKMDEDIVEEKEQSRSSVLLTSSLFEFGYMVSKGSIIKGVTVYITKEWMAKYLDIANTGEVLQRYIALKSSSLNLEPFDAEYHSLVDEITEDTPVHPLKKVMIQNRVMLLVEYFFSRLQKKMKELNPKLKAGNAEIRKLMDAEALLVHDYSKPAPTIPELAKAATMSETKLKVLFKKVYGHSPYEYYQVNRMNKARQMLLSRKYSIKETGMLLGYHNLSNFTIAFKKVFGTLPSEI